MKTHISKIIRIVPVIAFIIISGNVSGQKSVEYKSVGSNMEEVSEFFDDTCQSLDKIAGNVIDEFDKVVKQAESSEIAGKVTEWSEEHLKGFNEAAMEAKVWLKKQHFAPTKYKQAHSSVHDMAEKSNE